MEMVEHLYLSYHSDNINHISKITMQYPLRPSFMSAKKSYFLSEKGGQINEAIT